MTMTMTKDRTIRAAKIALGSTAAIILSELVHLEFATSAGIITLLTILTTRGATLKLASHRFLSFVMTIAFGFIIRPHAANQFHQVMGFFLFMFLMVECSYYFDWDGAISTNAVFGTHIFLMSSEFSLKLCLNEFGLLVIGTGLAVLLNIIVPSKSRSVQQKLTEVEQSMRGFMFRISEGLQNRQVLEDTMNSINAYFKTLDRAIDEAIAHKDNTLIEHTGFYINYFTLRRNQCTLLELICQNLLSLELDDYEDIDALKFIRRMAENFRIYKDPSERIQDLKTLIDNYRQRPLPTTRSEFERRAMVFCCLKDLEEYLHMKQKFFADLSDEQRKLYMHLT